jgi:hypothetical protein
MTKTEWFTQVLHLAPVILSFSPLAPIAPAIAAGIIAAEKIKGASGAEKLAHVQEIAHAAAEATNAAAGREVVSVIGIDQAAANAISTVVSVVNVVHQAKAPAA